MSPHSGLIASPDRPSIDLPSACLDVICSKACALTFIEPAAIPWLPEFVQHFLVPIIPQTGAPLPNHPNDVRPPPHGSTLEPEEFGAGLTVGMNCNLEESVHSRQKPYVVALPFLIPTRLLGEQNLNANPGRKFAHESMEHLETLCRSKMVGWLSLHHEERIKHVGTVVVSFFFPLFISQSANVRFSRNGSINIRRIVSRQM